MNHTMNKSAVAIGIVVLWLSMAGFGCGQDSSQPAAASAPPAAQPAAAPPAQPPAQPPPAPPPAPSAGVLATTEGEVPGITAEVRELERGSGGTVTLKFSMINQSDGRLEFGYGFVDPAHGNKDYGSIAGVHLVDAAAKKKYFVIRDTDDNCLCSVGLKNVEPNSRINLWAKFPAPPEGVDRISIVIPHFAPADDVLISR